MESQVWDLILKSVAGGGAVAACLLGALWWMNRSNVALVTELKAEREESKEERERRFKALEAESSSCKADRTELHKMVTILKDQIIDIYKSRDQKTIIAAQRAATAEQVAQTGLPS